MVEPHRSDRLMQRLNVGFPLQINPGACRYCFGIVRFKNERAVQSQFCVGILLEKDVAIGNLLEREKIARIELIRALETAQRLFMFSLASFDVSAQFEDA